MTALESKLLAEIRTELTWLRHIRPQLTLPASIALGFDQAEKSLAEAVRLAEEYDSVNA